MKMVKLSLLSICLCKYLRFSPTQICVPLIVMSILLWCRLLVISMASDFCSASRMAAVFNHSFVFCAAISSFFSSSHVSLARANITVSSAKASNLAPAGTLGSGWEVCRTSYSTRLVRGLSPMELHLTGLLSSLRFYLVLESKESYLWGRRLLSGEDKAAVL